jgi:quinol monooxygenase YgiN
VIRPSDAGEPIATRYPNKEDLMSVLITVTFRGDVAKFQQAVVEHADELATVSERGRNGGCLHHRFGLGDGVVVAYDEWESAAHFEKFFSSPEMQEFTVRMGASAGEAPQVVVTEALSTVDQF